MKKLLLIFALLCASAEAQILQQIMQKAPSAASATLTEDTVAATPNCSTGTATCSISSATLTSGHLYVVTEITTNTAATHKVCDGAACPTTSANTWTAFSWSCHTESPTGNLQICAWWTIPSSTTTVTVNAIDSASPNFISAAIIGASSSTGWPASPIDKAGTIADTDAASLLNSTAFTLSGGATGSTTNNVEWVIGAFGIKYGATPGSPVWAASGSFTQRANNGGTVNNPAVQMEDQFTTTTGNYTASATITQNSGSTVTANASAVTLALKPN